MTTRYLLAFAALALLSCGPRPEPETQASAVCQAPPATPVSPSQTALALTPESSLSASVKLPRQVLLEQLSTQVPVTLAQARDQSIGVAGRVTYRIVRGPLELNADPTGLKVTTTLRGDIDVCKPVGPFCARYGSCKPTWNVHVTLPTDYERDPTLRVSTQVEVSKGCVLQPVGYDATSELERITRDETRKVRRRIAHELQRAQRELDQAWAELQQPQALSGSCLRFEPTAVHYTPISEDAAGNFETQLELRGHVHHQPLQGEQQPTAAAGAHCAHGSDQQPLQPKQVTRLTPGVNLASSTLWALPDVQTSLNTALGYPAALQLAGPAAGQTENRLYVGLQHASGCSDWVQVTPELAATELRLRLPEAATTTPQRQALNAVKLALPPGALSLAEQRSSAIAALSQAGTRLQRVGLTLKQDLAPSARVHPVAEGLLLVFELRGQVSAEPHGKISPQP